MIDCTSTLLYSQSFWNLRGRSEKTEELPGFSFLSRKRVVHHCFVRNSGVSFPFSLDEKQEMKCKYRNIKWDFPEGGVGL
jgi:hypothetical protein